MSRRWNGNLLDNTRSGDALATIVTEYVALPCAIITTAGALWWAYSAGATWPYYLVALVGGSVGGLFLAAAIGLAVAALLVILTIVFLPLEMAYKRYFRPDSP